MTVAALERAALGDDYVARCLGGAVDPAGGSTAAPSEPLAVGARHARHAREAAVPPPVDAPPACFSCVFAKSRKPCCKGFESFPAPPALSPGELAHREGARSLSAEQVL